jgi:hypothetical protein
MQLDLAPLAMNVIHEPSATFRVSVSLSSDDYAASSFSPLCDPTLRRVLANAPAR